jgi:hypothetical protein
VWVSVLWALVHSLLASRRAKDLARRVAGAHYRDGLYRTAYNAQALASVVWLARWFARLSDRGLYKVRPPLSWYFRAGQAASLGVLLSGVRVIGVLELAGLTPLWRLLTGKEVNPEPEAQGPPSAPTERWSGLGPSASRATPAIWVLWGSSCSCLA